MMHSPPVSDFPLISKNFQTLLNIFTILPFPDIFPVSVHPPVSRKLLFPYFEKFSPLFYKNSLAFLYTLFVFRFPPTLTMMHLCITQCTYWTPLQIGLYYEFQ